MITEKFKGREGGLLQQEEDNEDDEDDAKCSPEKAAQLFALGTQNACIYNNSSNGPMA